MSNIQLKNILNELCDAANKKHLLRKKHYAKKWILRDGEKELVSDELTEVSVGFTIESISKEASYVRFMEYLKGHKNVQEIIPIAGRNTQPKQLVAKLLKEAYLASEERFDADRLLNHVSEFITLLSNESHDFSIVGRLHGVSLEVDCIELSKNVLLAALDEGSINKRQPRIQDEITGPRDYPVILDYSNSNVEVRVVKSYVITPHRELSYFEVANNAQKDLNRMLESVINAIKLYKQGIYAVYPVSLTSSPLIDRPGETYTTEPRYINPFKKLVLNASDREMLRKLFELVEFVIPQDPVLVRSFSRFMIGVDERVPEERLVDYIIAWESLLLTINGNSEKSELRYRFSLNGAALLTAVDGELEFTKMQCLMKMCYDIRSTIVHGSDIKSLNKEINKQDVTDLVALNEKLHELYRKAILWIASIKVEYRPYKAQYGWEKLLREKKI